MPKFHTLTMGGGPMTKGLEVFLDGMPLKGVTNLNIVCNYDDVIRVTLEMIVDLAPTQMKVVPELELPLNIEALPPHMQTIAGDLMALVEKQKEAT